MGEEKVVLIDDLLQGGKEGIAAYNATIRMSNVPHFIQAVRPMPEIDVERLSWDEQLNKDFETFVNNVRFGFQQIPGRYCLEPRHTFKFPLPFAFPTFVDVYAQTREGILDSAVIFTGFLGKCECCGDLEYITKTVFLGGSHLAPKKGWDLSKKRRKSVPRMDGAVRYFLRKKGFREFVVTAVYDTLNCDNVAAQYKNAMTNYLAFRKEQGVKAGEGKGGLP